MKYKLLSKKEIEYCDEVAKNCIKYFRECRCRLQYNERAIEIIEMFIEKVRLLPDQRNYDYAKHAIGYFIGKCIIENYGGVWIMPAKYTWPHIKINDLVINPMKKVEKQFQNGVIDSISKFYCTIGQMTRNSENSCLSIIKNSNFKLRIDDTTNQGK